MSEESLRIRFQVNYPRCNLSCPYCITAPARVEDRFSEETFRSVVGGLQRIPARINLHLGVEGEVFASPCILEEIRRLTTERNNIDSASTISNLAANWERVIEPFLRSVDPHRFSIGCTLHDTVIADVDGFFLKVTSIRRLGILTYVTHVILPGRIEQTRLYKMRCDELGVPFIPNPLLGVWPSPGGETLRSYPAGFTTEEVVALKKIWDNPHSFKLLVEGCSPKGMRCGAGRDYLFVDSAGNVYPCNKFKQPLGNILKDEIRVFSEDVFCPSDRCFCGNQNQALRIVDAYYERTRNIRILVPKPEISLDQLYKGYPSPPFLRERGF